MATKPSPTPTLFGVSLEETVAAWVSEPDFSTIANQHPRLWRRLAIELGDRLRQRGIHVPAKNAYPHFFIGSSSESLPAARGLQTGLTEPNLAVYLWSVDVFDASKTTIENLEAEIGKADFAALVLGPDDRVISRGTERDAPRDNVVFELGLFMGALTRSRTYIVQPHGSDLKLPTDLLGITVLQYDPSGNGNLADKLTPICTAIRKLVADRGCK